MENKAKGDELPHLPVLYQEITHYLKPTHTGLYVDCTLGAGGHAARILQAASPDGRLLGLDVDPQALELARERLEPFGSRAILLQASYVDLEEHLLVTGWTEVNGVLIDLGVSSMQLDTPGRGFSFKSAAPLDMRFDPQRTISAADIVNNSPEKELADLIFQYGEERRARQVARAIVNARPIRDTQQLAEVVSRAVTARRKKKTAASRIHPATRTFQAIRIAVNQELESLKDVLPQAIRVLAPAGRLAVISYHSLEDRLVKVFFRQESKDCICPPEQPICTCDHQASVIEITRRPIRPQPEEVEKNPRSRSARLRVVEKI